MNAPTPSVPLLPDHPVLRKVRILDVLRHRPGRHTVYGAEYRGEPCVLKLFRHGQPDKAVRQTGQTLARTTEVLDSHSFAVNRPILLLPEAGAILLEIAPGKQLSLELAAASDARRAQLIGRAGQWLARLGADRQRGHFAPFFWVDQTRIRAASADNAVDEHLIAAQLALLTVEAHRVRGLQADRGRMHGDFTPDNMFVDDRCLTVIDMEREITGAFIRDIARFLVWLHSRRSEVPKRTTNGVSSDDYNAITGIPELFSADQSPVLRFFIGKLLTDFYLDSQGRRLRREILASAILRWQGGD